MESASSNQTEGTNAIVMVIDKMFLGASINPNRRQ